VPIFGQRSLFGTKRFDAEIVDYPLISFVVISEWVGKLIDRTIQWLHALNELVRPVA
jgi:hypothetical protein